MKHDTGLKISLYLLAALITFGVAGFIVLDGKNFFDAAELSYNAIFSHFYHTTPGPLTVRLLVMALVLGSYVALAYLAKWFAEELFGGTISENHKRKKMQNSINELSGHYIVCGQGRVGKQVAEELAQAGKNFVVIDYDEKELALAKEQNWLYLNNDLTDDDSLKTAGVEKAAGLIAALGRDTDNVFVTLIARSLNPNLIIVARANDDSTQPMLIKAGATSVVLPYVIGGSFMAKTLTEAKGS